MKPILTITCLLFLFYYSKAQDTTGRPLDCIESNICSYDLYANKMDNGNLPAKFSTIIVSDRISYAKSNNPSGYPGDVLYDNENNTVCEDNLSNETEHCYANTDALKYVVYYPKPYDA